MTVLRRWCALALLCAVVPAWADVWGYIDAQGVAHFAAEPVDARYELFYRSNQDDDLPSQGLVRNLGLVPAAGAAQPRLLAYFEVSPGYKAVQHLLREAALQYQIDPQLLKAVIATESGFDAKAVSPRGAVGLMQLMPITAAYYGIKPGRSQRIEQLLAEPRLNLQIGAHLLHDLLQRHHGQLDLALAAYNAGIGSVQRAGNRIPDNPETRNFVKTVLQLHALLQPPPTVVAQRQAQTPAQDRPGPAAGGALGRGNMVPVLTRTTPLPLAPVPAVY